MSAAAKSTFERFLLDLSNVVQDRKALQRLGAILEVDSKWIGTLHHDKSTREGIAGCAYDVIAKWKSSLGVPSLERVRDRLEAKFRENATDLDYTGFMEVKEKYYSSAGSGATRGSTTTASGGSVADSGASVGPRHPGQGVQAHGITLEEVDFDIPDVPEQLSQYPIRKYSHLGRALIINVENYTDGITEDRTGTQADEDSLRTVVKNIGLDLTDDPSPDQPDGSVAQLEQFVIRNPGLEQIRKKLQEVANLDHKDYACFCCFILSHGGNHGSKNYFKTADGQIMTIKDLTDYFKGENCESLVGKPKLFFIQACQGSGLDSGVKVKEEADSDDDEPGRVLPTEADIFVFYATPFGFKSWRHPIKGTRFIQCLCAALKELHDDCDILEIATIVNEMVAHIEGDNGYKQVSMVTSTLRKKFRFCQLRR